MMSADHSKQLTKTEAFTQWTSLAYVLVGVSMLLIPSLWGILWDVQLVGRTVGYIQVGGLSLAVEGVKAGVLIAEHNAPKKYGDIGYIGRRESFLLQL